MSWFYQIHIYMNLSIYEAAALIIYHTFERGCFYDKHEVVLQEPHMLEFPPFFHNITNRYSTVIWFVACLSTV